MAQVGLHLKKALVDPALWALKDITVEATWCYPVTMWPRVIAMIEKGKLRVERIVTARIGADDVVEKGFRTLLDPAGNQMKVMVPGRVTNERRSYPRPEMRRCSASSRTAAMMIAPVAKSCQKMSIRERFRKLRIRAMMITPMMVRRMLPWPP